jgi:Mn2+/Fe2+ NRAMP family transporter
VGLTVAAASVVSLPGMPLIPLIYTSQVVNAVMLPLHVVALQLLARDPAIMGDARSGKATQIAAWVSIGLILACVGALGWSWIGSQGAA